jgi:FkbM family methyltransferase
LTHRPRFAYIQCKKENDAIVLEALAIKDTIMPPQTSVTTAIDIAKEVRLRPAEPYEQPFDFIDLPLSIRVAQWIHTKNIKPLSKLERHYSKWVHNPDTPTFDMTMVYHHPRGARQWGVRSANHQYRFALMPRFRHHWEKEIFSLLAILAEEGKANTVYDIGANWGQHSLYLCSLPAFKGHIHAFEPIPATYDDLSHNINKAGLTSQITAHDVALSHESGTATMVIPKNIFSGRAHIVNSGKGYTVPKCRLDSLGLPLPDVIKLDVEGHELGVLQGAEATLLKAKPAIIFENLYINDKAVMLAPLEFLEKRGAMLYLISLDGEDVLLTPLKSKNRDDYPFDANLFACFQRADAYFNV